MTRSFLPFSVEDCHLLYLELKVLKMKTEISTENRKKKQQKKNNNNNKKNDLGCVRSQLLKVNGLRQNFSLGV